MPVRLNAKIPGAFIRNHLRKPRAGGRDYVGSMCQAYEEHLHSTGVRRLPCLTVFQKYSWLLKETVAIKVDGDKAVSFGAGMPQAGW